MDGMKTVIDELKSQNELLKSENETLKKEMTEIKHALGIQSKTVETKPSVTPTELYIQPNPAQGAYKIKFTKYFLWKLFSYLLLRIVITQ